MKSTHGVNVKKKHPKNPHICIEVPTSHIQSNGEKFIDVQQHKYKKKASTGYRKSRGQEGTCDFEMSYTNKN